MCAFAQTLHRRSSLHVQKDHEKGKILTPSARAQENASLQKAIAESSEAIIRVREEDKVSSLSELANHLRSQGMKLWDVIERNERLLLVHIVDDEAPWLKYSVCVKGDLSVTLHVMKTAVKKLGANLCVPEIANIKRGLVELLEDIEKWDGGKDEDELPLKRARRAASLGCEDERLASALPRKETAAVASSSAFSSWPSRPFPAHVCASDTMQLCLRSIFSLLLFEWPLNGNKLSTVAQERHEDCSNRGKRGSRKFRAVGSAKLRA
ncbi:hypothetical protein HPB52_014934 [Rhipicephalus sanguineus]|uniref:Uncharacterized protein n=1 Tax=Rhipicephalus sanguineus TaxID=34632 RepID=A0A9D4Q9H7_RHISA|nr:hypothetical protein HPB52_014934 [Rhipicephalus sanguineus]